MRLALELVNSVDCPSQCSWALSNTLKAWIGQKVEGGILSCLTAWARISHLIFFALRLDLHHNSPGSQAFGLRLIHTTSFFGSSGVQFADGIIMGLLSLQNCMSQFQIISLSPIEEPWLIHVIYSFNLLNFPVKWKWDSNNIGWSQKSRKFQVAVLHD